MKNLKLGLMLFIVVLASGSSKAMGTLKVDVVPGEKEKVLVDVLEAPASQFMIELKDSHGNVIYSDKIAPSSFNYKKVYDFSKLANGKYTFEATLGDETELNNLVVNNGIVQIIGQEEQISPSFKLDGKFLEFTFPNSLQKSAKLLLYDNDNNNLIFQEALKPEYDIQQALNLATLRSGHYKAVLKSDKTSYYYDFYIG